MPTIRLHIGLLSVLFAPAAAGQTLVPAGATWKYLDNGSNQGTAWRTPAFNDSAWASGLAELGYGDGDEATVVSYGPNSNAKYATTYFRKAFSVTDPRNYAGLTLRVKRDDGVVVYINGTEVFRDNITTGPVFYYTWAPTAADDGMTFIPAAVSPSVLVAGTNVIAVEIHQSGGTSSDLSFDLELTASAAPTVTRGPYLQQGTPSGVIVRWRTSAATNSVVRYGTSASSLTSSAVDAAITTEHALSLTGLAPNSRYYYSVGTSAATLAGDSTFTFMTPPAANSSRPTRIWVLGDSGTKNANAVAVRNAYYAYTGTRHTDLWLMLGDNAYDNGTDAEYQAAVFDMYPVTLRQSVLWPTIGNHDTAQSTSPSSSLPYFQMFSLPANGESGGVASGTEKYYSFDFGNVHFVCLDSMSTSRAPGSPMLTWLQSDLSANTKDWLIAFWHHPPYTKGSHDSDAESALIDMRQNVLPILEAYGVDLVLTGHSHSYERSFLIDGHYGPSTTFTNSMKKDAGGGRMDGTGAYQKAALGPGVHNGAVYAVAGSSGQTAGGPLNHPAMFISLNNLGSMVLDVDAGRLDVKFLRETGAIADYFTILKGATTYALNPTTTSVGFAAGSGNVTLDVSPAGASWTASSNSSWLALAAGSTSGAGSTTLAYSYTANTSPDARTGLISVGSATHSVTQAGQFLIPTGATWKYLDNGSNQGTAWRAPAFNDSGWASGRAELGYGDGDEATVVGYGPNVNAKYATTYFRKAFSVANPGLYSALTLRVKRDDGVVVYINGTEVFRNNITTGTVFYYTWAPTATDDGMTFIQAAVSPSVLVAGSNVIAVEIHQSGGTSSDLSFDLELTGSAASTVSRVP